MLPKGESTNGCFLWGAGVDLPFLHNPVRGAPHPALTNA